MPVRPGVIRPAIHGHTPLPLAAWEEGNTHPLGQLEGRRGVGAKERREGKGWKRGRGGVGEKTVCVNQGSKLDPPIYNTNTDTPFQQAVQDTCTYTGYSLWLGVSC